MSDAEVRSASDDPSLILPYPCSVTVIKENGMVGKTYHVEDQRAYCIMGSHPDCDVRIQTSGIATVHALLRVKVHGVFLHGLDAEVPVVIPRLKKSILVKQQVQLNNNDVILLGKRKFVISFQSPILDILDPNASSNANSPVEAQPSASPPTKPSIEASKSASRRRRSSLVVRITDEAFVPKTNPSKLLKFIPPCANPVESSENLAVSQGSSSSESKGDALSPERDSLLPKADTLHPKADSSPVQADALPKDPTAMPPKTAALPPKAEVSSVGPSTPPGRIRKARSIQTATTPTSKTQSQQALRLAKTPSKTPAKASAKTPAKTPAKTLAKTPAKTLAKTPAKTSAKTPAKTPARALARTPAKTPAKPPTATGSESARPVNTPVTRSHSSRMFSATRFSSKDAIMLPPPGTRKTEVGASSSTGFTSTKKRDLAFNRLSRGLPATPHTTGKTQQRQKARPVPIAPPDLSSDSSPSTDRDQSRNEEMAPVVSELVKQFEDEASQSETAVLAPVAVVSSEHLDVNSANAELPDLQANFENVHISQVTRESDIVEEPASVGAELKESIESHEPSILPVEGIRTKLDTHDEEAKEASVQVQDGVDMCVDRSVEREASLAGPKDDVEIESSAAVAESVEYGEVATAVEMEYRDVDLNAIETSSQSIGKGTVAIAKEESNSPEANREEIDYESVNVTVQEQPATGSQNVPGEQGSDAGNVLAETQAETGAIDMEQIVGAKSESEEDVTVGMSHIQDTEVLEGDDADMMDSCDEEGKDISAKRETPENHVVPMYAVGEDDLSAEDAVVAAMDEMETLHAADVATDVATVGQEENVLQEAIEASAVQTELDTTEKSVEMNRPVSEVYTSTAMETAADRPTHIVNGGNGEREMAVDTEMDTTEKVLAGAMVSPVESSEVVTPVESSEVVNRSVATDEEAAIADAGTVGEEANEVVTGPIADARSPHDSGADEEREDIAQDALPINEASASQHPVKVDAAATEVLEDFEQPIADTAFAEEASDVDLAEVPTDSVDLSHESQISEALHAKGTELTSAVDRVVAVEEIGEEYDVDMTQESTPEDDSACAEETSAVDLAAFPVDAVDLSNEPQISEALHAAGSEPISATDRVVATGEIGEEYDADMKQESCSEEETPENVGSGLLTSDKPQEDVSVGQALETVPKYCDNMDVENRENNVELAIDSKLRTTAAEPVHLLEAVVTNIDQSFEQGSKLDNANDGEIGDCDMKEANSGELTTSVDGANVDDVNDEPKSEVQDEESENVCRNEMETDSRNIESDSAIATKGVNEAGVEDHSFPEEDDEDSEGSLNEIPCDTVTYGVDSSSVQQDLVDAHGETGNAIEEDEYCEEEDEDYEKEESDDSSSYDEKEETFDEALVDNIVYEEEEDAEDGAAQTEGAGLAECVDVAQASQIGVPTVSHDIALAEASGVVDTTNEILESARNLDDVVENTEASNEPSNIVIEDRTDVIIDDVMVEDTDHLEETAEADEVGTLPTCPVSPAASSASTLEAAEEQAAPEECENEKQEANGADCFAESVETPSDSGKHSRVNQMSKASDMAMQLEKKTVKDLRAILKDRGYLTAGLKRELIMRILIDEGFEDEIVENVVMIMSTPRGKTPRSSRKLGGVDASVTRRSTRSNRFKAVDDDEVVVVHSDGDSESDDGNDDDSVGEIDDVNNSDVGGNETTDGVIPTPLQEVDGNANSTASTAEDESEEGNDSNCGDAEKMGAQYRKKTVRELREILAERAIDLPTKMRKDELIELLMALSLTDEKEIESEPSKNEESVKNENCDDDKAAAVVLKTAKDMKLFLKEHGMCQVGTKAILSQRVETIRQGRLRRTRRSMAGDTSMCSACKEGDRCSGE